MAFSMVVIRVAASAPQSTSGRSTISRAAVNTPNSFPQTNSEGSRSVTSSTSSAPRSRSVVMLVTAIAATASRLANAIGTTATATASPSGRGRRASATMPATAAAKSRSQARRTSSSALPCALVQISRQSTGLSQTTRDGRFAETARAAPPAASGCRRASWVVFQARTRLTATTLAATINAAATARNGSSVLPPVGVIAANTARAGDTCAPTAAPNRPATTSPIATHATSAKVVMANA